MARAAGVWRTFEFFRDPPEASLKMLAWNDRSSEVMASSPGVTTLNSDAWSWGLEDQFTTQNPPPRFLRAECEKLTRSPSPAATARACRPA